MGGTLFKMFFNVTCTVNCDICTVNRKAMMNGPCESIGYVEGHITNCQKPVKVKEKGF